MCSWVSSLVFRVGASVFTHPSRKVTRTNILTVYRETTGVEEPQWGRRVWGGERFRRLYQACRVSIWNGQSQQKKSRKPQWRLGVWPPVEVQRQARVSEDDLRHIRILKHTPLCWDLRYEWDIWYMKLHAELSVTQHVQESFHGAPKPTLCKLPRKTMQRDTKHQHFV